MSDDVRRAAERLLAYYRGEQPGIYYTEEDARAAFTGDVLKVAEGYQSLREQLEQAKIRVKQLEAGYEELRTIANRQDERLRELPQRKENDESR